MSKIKEIYSTLCLFSVFRNLLSTPVFKAFIEYCETEDKKDKPKKYGALVSEIYKNGGSLTECVKKALYEDENVYVKSTISVYSYIQTKAGITNTSNIERCWKKRVSNKV